MSNPLTKEEALATISQLIQEFHVDFDAIQRYVYEKDLLIPASIFVPEISCFAAICIFLKDSKHLRFHEIAVLLQRNDRTIWTTYTNAKKKFSHPLQVTDMDIYIPLRLLQDRKHTIFEHIVLYFRDVKKMRYHDIAVLVHRNDRTIWTTYHRVKKSG